MSLCLPWETTYKHKTTTYINVTEIPYNAEFPPASREFVGRTLKLKNKTKEKNLTALNCMIWVADSDHKNRKLYDQEIIHAVIELFLAMYCRWHHSVEITWRPHPYLAIKIENIYAHTVQISNFEFILRHSVSLWKPFTRYAVL